MKQDITEQEEIETGQEIAKPVTPFDIFFVFACAFTPIAWAAWKLLQLSTRY